MKLKIIKEENNFWLGIALISLAVVGTLVTFEGFIEESSSIDILISGLGFIVVVGFGIWMIYNPKKIREIEMENVKDYEVIEDE